MHRSLLEVRLFCCGILDDIRELQLPKKWAAELPTGSDQSLRAYSSAAMKKNRKRFQVGQNPGL
jgi:hypothetical protein